MIALFRPTRWTGHVAFIAVLIAIAQINVEGPRWQMVPASVLTALFFMACPLQSTTPAGRPVNRVAANLIIGLAALALVVSVALPIASPVFRFPRPTGPYAIGTLNTFQEVEELISHGYIVAAIDQQYALQKWPSQMDARSLD